MEEIVIVAAKRTAIGKYGGSLTKVPVVELGTQSIKSTMGSISLNPSLVDEVIMGNVLSGNTGQNPARQAAIKAGIPQETTAFTINKLCGSGMKAVHLGFNAIKCGDAEIVVAGGMENMSDAPYLIPKARWGARMGNFETLDSLLRDGLLCAINNYHMGMTAENLATKFNISREEQDAFACESQNRTEKAQKEGLFDAEITPVEVGGRKPFVFDKDEFPRAGATIEGLQKLRPAFKKDGTVTAGNASGINDGASAVVMMKKSKAEELNLPIMANLKGFATAGVDPAIMGYGPIAATRKLLDRYNLTVDDFDLIESNEAFAVQSVVVLKELGLDPEKVNVNGGAIALGHPIGESGSRILVTLLHEMQRRKNFRGLATMCIGGGLGISAYVEMPE